MIVEWSRRSDRWEGMAGRIADEAIAHLAALPGAIVDVTLEVQVKVGEGVEEDVVRTVSENATALKFDHASFEKD